MLPDHSGSARALRFSGNRRAEPPTRRKGADVPMGDTDLYSLYVPDGAGVLRDGSVAGKFTDASYVEDRLPRPSCSIIESCACLFLSLQVSGQVRQVQIFIVLIEEVLIDPGEEIGFTRAEQVGTECIDHPFHARIAIVMVPWMIGPLFAHRLHFAGL